MKCFSAGAIGLARPGSTWPGVGISRLFLNSDIGRVSQEILSTNSTSIIIHSLVARPSPKRHLAAAACVNGRGERVYGMWVVAAEEFPAVPIIAEAPT